MPIQTQSADGVTHEFPDDTSPEIVDKAMKTYAEEHRNKTTTLEQVGRGAMDPVEGGAQLLSNITPEPVRQAIDTANNWLADKTGLVGKLPPGGMNQRVKEREAEIQKERGYDKSIDWARMTGDMLSPINYIGPAIIGGAGKLVNAARATVGGMASGATQPATKKDIGLEKAEQIGLGGLIGAGFGAATGAIAGAADKIGEYVARKYPENIASDAVQKILRRFKQDEKAGSPSAAEALDLIETAKKPVALVDVSGENVRGLGGNVARQPGGSRNIATSFLNKRDEGAAQRLSDDIGTHLFSGQTAHQATEALLESRSAASKIAYDKVWDLQKIWSPRLGTFFADPAVKQGMSKGYEIERMQSLARGEPLTAKQMGVDIDVDGNVKMVDVPNMRVLDMAKQGLDAMIASERNEITGRLSAKGVAIDKLRRAYLEEIDSLDTSGTYRKARETWGGYSASMDAIRLGRTAFQSNPEENAAALAGLSPANREFYRMGLADLLKERLAKAGLSSDDAKQLIRNPWTRDQLRPAFKTKEDFDQFVDAVTTESKMFGTRQATLGGSQTAGRLAEDESEGNMADVARLAAHAAKGSWWSAAKATYQFYRDMGLKPNPELNEKIAQVLFSAPAPADNPIVQALRTGIVPAKLNPAGRATSEISQAGVGLGTGGAAGITEEFK
jgi:hypothetical protein